MRHTRKDPYTSLNISEEIKTIIAEITEAQSEKNDVLVNELTEELIRLIDMHEDKYGATAHVIQNALSAAESNKAIAAQFQAIATGHNNIVKRLKSRLLDDMRQQDLKTIETGDFTIRTQKNSVPTLTINVPATELPERFQIIESNNKELRHALSKGERVEGVELEKGEHIRIFRRKKNATNF